MEQVLVLIKPDGMQKGTAGLILNDFMKSPLKLVALKAVSPSVAQARKHYALLSDQFFFAQIVDYLTGKFHKGAPVVAMVFEGKDAIKQCRTIAGATNPEDSDPRSIRGKYGRITTKGLYENVVHVSSSVEEARREIAIWFKKAELL